MSITKEITVWCDHPECAEWMQFNGTEAGGSAIRARRQARKRRWSYNPKDGDRCPKHVDKNKWSPKE